jgi:MOSC domain-containing protein YiiM
VRIRSIQVGRPQRLGSPDAADLLGKPWTSGYGKQPVGGPIFCGRVNLDGDGQHDKRWHGGPEMAVLAYSAEHYARWAEEGGGGPALGAGAFAENLTIEGADEESVCIGDVWAIAPAAAFEGEASREGERAPAGCVELQVSEPRKPCNNISRFHHRKDLLQQVIETGRYGWYLRVLREGTLEAGMQVRLLRRPQPEWTVAQAMEARLGLARRPEAARALAAVPELGADWRQILLDKLAGKEPTP